MHEFFLQQCEMDQVALKCAEHRPMVAGALRTERVVLFRPSSEGKTPSFGGGSRCMLGEVTVVHGGDAMILAGFKHPVEQR